MPSIEIAAPLLAPTGTAAAGRVSLKDMSFSDLEEWCATHGEKRSRALHIWRWLYYDGNWIRHLSDAVGVQNGFGRAFVEAASNFATVDGGLHLQEVHESSDGTRKMLFALDDDSTAQVETVLIPVVREEVRLNAHLCALPVTVQAIVQQHNMSQTPTCTRRLGATHQC